MTYVPVEVPEERGVSLWPAPDGLPTLAGDVAVPAAAAKEFAAKGHTVVRGLASADEVAAFKPVIEEATWRNGNETRPLEERDTYGKAFIQVPNLWRVDEGVQRFVLARRFGRVAAALMGVQGVRIYHDQALFKEAGGGPTPWHQDQYYWPLDTDRTITMWMPLVDVPSAVGTMTFASGSHKLGFLGEFPISDESDAIFKAMLDEKGLPLDSHGALAAGDATFHAGWTLHSAPPNPSDSVRSVMTVIYMADGIRVTEPVNEAQRNDMANWLTGCQPGDLAAGPRNPLVYP